MGDLAREVEALQHLTDFIQSLLPLRGHQQLLANIGDLQGLPVLPTGFVVHALQEVIKLLNGSNKVILTL